LHGGVGDELATIRRDREVGLANGLWYYDRYKDLEPLDPGRAVVIADPEGPGVIRQIHITQHPNLNEAGLAPQCKSAPRCFCDHPRRSDAPHCNDGGTRAS
jgi:hypothetical protein